MMSDESLRVGRRIVFIIHHSSFIILFLALSAFASPSSWLRSHALPLSSVEPSADDSDLAPLLPFVANAHVIALGDVAHGTHELYAVKQRLIRFLIKHANVRTVVLEAPFGELEVIREYVRTGAGDPAALLRNDDYFFWNTDEVLDTIRWIRAWNAAGNPPVDVAGIDAYHTETSIARVLSMLDAATRDEVERAYACVAHLTIASSQRTRDACHAAVMSVRPLLESRHASADVLYAARVVEQGEGALNRDSAMAENLERLADRAGSGNFVLWGHNEHVGKSQRSAGQMLFEHYAAGYVAIGSVALRGSFVAADIEDGLVASRVMSPASEDDVASLFATASMPLMIVPFRGALPAWLTQPRPMRIAGSTSLTTVTVDEELPKRFDAVIYVETTTPARLRK
jgi:erythromycin esterase